MILDKYNQDRCRCWVIYGKEIVMKIPSIAILAASLAIVISGSAQAQLLMDQAAGTAVGGGTELSSAARAPSDVNTITNQLQAQGYSNISVSPNDPHQFTATASGGTAVIVAIDPATGKVLSVVPQ